MSAVRELFLCFRRRDVCAECRAASCEDVVLAVLVRRRPVGECRADEGIRGARSGTGFEVDGENHAPTIAMARRQYTVNARKERSDTAMEVVTTAKMASGIETDSRIKGVTA